MINDIVFTPSRKISRDAQPFTAMHRVYPPFRWKVHSLVCIHQRNPQPGLSPDERKWKSQKNLELRVDHGAPRSTLEIESMDHPKTSSSNRREKEKHQCAAW